MSTKCYVAIVGTSWNLVCRFQLIMEENQQTNSLEFSPVLDAEKNTCMRSVDWRSRQYMDCQGNIWSSARLASKERFRNCRHSNSWGICKWWPLTRSPHMTESFWMLRSKIWRWLDWGKHKVRCAKASEFSGFTVTLGENGYSIASPWLKPIIMLCSEWSAKICLWM